jgi:hypothetical protein
MPMDTVVVETVAVDGVSPVDLPVDGLVDLRRMYRTLATLRAVTTATPEGVGCGPDHMTTTSGVPR